MATAPASDSIMTPDKMKPLLAASKQEPVQAAFGMTDDGEAVILLHKKARPKQVLSMLKADAAKAKLKLTAATLRFGRAEVDTEYDPGMVRFFINKEAPSSLRVKLVAVVKRVPYQKVELNVDPALDEEAEEGADVSDGQAAAAQSAAPPPGVPQPPPQRAPEQTAPQPDAAALTRDLAVLIRRLSGLAAADASVRASLAKSATDANVALKTNNLRAAGELIAGLREALDATGAADGQAAAAPAEPPPDVAASRKALAGLIGRVAQVPNDDSGRKLRLGAIAGEANEALKAGDANAAEAAIARLREALDEGAQSGLAVPRGVAYRKMLLRWREAQGMFEANLKTLGATLLAQPDIRADPRFDQIKDAVAQLPKLVPVFGGRLEDTLDAGLNATMEEDARRLAKDGVTAIDDYRQKLAGASHLMELEQFAAKDLGASLPLHDALDAALVELRQELAA